MNFFKPDHAYQKEGIGSHPDGLPAYHGSERSGFYTRKHKLDPFESDKVIVDNQVVILGYATGVRAFFHTNINTAINERRMYLCGTEGTVRGDVQRI